MSLPPDLPFPFPEFGILRAMDGTAACQTCPETLDTPCGAPAAWHIAWTLTPGVSSSFACNRHMDEISRSYVYADRHPLGAACPLPAMTWFGPNGACLLDLHHQHETTHTTLEIA